jgi:hypothetical protein
MDSNTFFINPTILQEALHYGYRKLITTDNTGACRGWTEYGNYRLQASSLRQNFWQMMMAEYWKNPQSAQITLSTLHALVYGLHPSLFKEFICELGQFQFEERSHTSTRKSILCQKK